MSAFTCISCRVAFAEADLQRAHYKTDWHRYNLKRKVVDLPPVTAENFQQRVLSQRDQVAETDKAASFNCPVCTKHFNSQNAYDNHLKSKKHRDAELKNIEKEQEILRRNNKNIRKDATARTSATDNRATSTVLVQNRETTSEAVLKTDQNTAGPSGSGHKVTPATVVKPVQDSIEDMDSNSEESWDGEALGLEECLFCACVSDSLEDNLKHMTEAHSFFIPDVDYLTNLEQLISYLGEKVGQGHICLWCNEKGKAFSTTRAVQQHMLDKGHCKMLYDGETVFEYGDCYDYRKSYPDYQEKRVQAMDEDDEEDEEEVESEVLHEEDFQLVLPSGATVGHRSLQRYYRQKLRPDRTSDPNVVRKVMAHYKALGWVGSTGAVALRRAKDMSYVKRFQHKYHMRLGVKANKLQSHFRNQYFIFK